MNAGRQAPSRRLKILFCSPEVPYPADSGLKVRVFNLARELARRHEIHLFCLSRVAADPGALAVIKDAGIGVTVLEKPCVKPAVKLTTYLSRLVRGVPLPYILSWEKAIFRGLDSLLADRFDVIVAEHLFMARYVLKVNAVKVITEHNVEWELAAQLASLRPAPQRWIGRAEAAWIAAYEKKMLRSFTGAVAVSEPDRKAFVAMAPAVPVTLVGNGVDCGRYLELLEAPRPRELRMLFLGLMSYQPNEDAVFWFVREVLPRITASYPDAVFTIAGAQPAERVLALDKGASVRVAGAVADVKDCYRENSVMVVPLNFGSGSRLKILEAFAAGTPVVSTAKGAEGLDAENERHLLIADTPEAFAAAVIRLHEDRQLYRDLKQNARRLAEERYDWPVQAALLEQALLDALGRRSALPDRTNG
ncbi:MAG: glycosyltransferase family 4 protein [Thermoleophilia bacterium]